MNSNMPVYYRCNLSMIQRLGAYLAGSLLIAGVAWLFYKIWLVSLLVGCVGGIFVEKLYVKSSIQKRQNTLLLQFRDFLESMSVAARAGNVEIKALHSARNDLRLSYSGNADIVREVEHIIVQYEQGGKQLRELFLDWAERSGLEDIRNFATVYAVIERKNDRFGDILISTQEIIGDKIEIEQEIQTVITSAKSETYMMFIMPVIIVFMMGNMGGGIMDALFTTTVGHLVATLVLIILVISFAIAVKVTEIKV